MKRFTSEEIKEFISKPLFDKNVILNKDPSYPKVSVITPSYNQAQFLERTILSVLNQNYPNLEYIIIDGGSTDGSIEIIKKYEKYLSYWVSEKDRGQSDAINKGFGMAKGEIFAWLNSDDTYLPGAIKEVVEFFKSYHDVGIVYGMSHFTDETDNVIDNYPTESFDYKRLASFNFISQPSTFFKKNVYYKVGGLDTGLQFAFDYDLWIKMADKFKIEYLPDLLATYRLHKESKSIFERNALKRDEEAIRIVLKYYHWVPANRVYGYCYHLIKSKIPASLVRVSPVIFLLTFIIFCKEYLTLNRGIRLDDIKLINIENIKKLFGGWELKDKLRTF
jgi:glycosyltransferase involved in cell wall biosynthesis